MIAEPSDCIAPAVTCKMIKNIDGHMSLQQSCPGKRKCSNVAAPWPRAACACLKPEACSNKEGQNITQTSIPAGRAAAETRRARAHSAMQLQREVRVQ
jgi:hypothetical protein